MTTGCINHEYMYWSRPSDTANHGDGDGGGDDGGGGDGDLLWLSIHQLESALGWPHDDLS